MLRGRLKYPNDVGIQQPIGIGDLGLDFEFADRLFERELFGHVAARSEQGLDYQGTAAPVLINGNHELHRSTWGNSFYDTAIWPASAVTAIARVRNR